MVAASKINKFLKSFYVSITACRHIRVVCPHYLHTAEIHLLQLIKVRLPFSVITQIIIDNFSSEYFTDSSISWITRIWNKHFIPRIAKSQGYIHNTFLAPNNRLNLCGRIYFHPIDAFVEACHCIM